MRIYFIICVLFFLINNRVAAQQRGVIENAPKVAADSLQESFSRVPDTIKIVYFYPQNPQEDYVFSDSLLENNFQQYDLTRKRKFDYANLGNSGSAHQPIVYESRFRKGFEVGLNQYDLYQIPFDTLKFYKLKVAYTNVFYSQSGDQNDAFFKGAFNRKFAKGLSLGIDYHRLGHYFVDAGRVPELRYNQNVSYPQQSGQHTALNTGLWYDHPNGKYDAFLSYAFNEIQHSDHGGLIDTLDFESILIGGKELNSIQSVPIYGSRSSMSTRHELKTVGLMQRFRLGGQVDTTGLSKRSFALSHQILYKSNNYKFSDASPSDTYYGDLYADERGVRHFISNRVVENSFKINTFKARKHSQKVKSQRDLLQVGITHTFNKIDQEPVDTIVNNLFLTGKFDFTPSERLKIKTYAHLGLWDQAGDYHINGSLFFALKKLGQLEVKASQQLYEPNLLQTRLFVAEQEKWNQDWSKTLETHLSLTYAQTAWQLELTGRYTLLNNYIYYDTLAMPQQEGKPISIGQLIATKKFTLGKFHLDNMVVLQQVSESVLRLPDLFSKHSLYFEGRLFKNVLLARLGFDLRMNTAYFANAYQPLTGQFHLQDRQSINWYPAVDVFLNFKVDRFRAFAKMENLTAYIEDNVYFTTPFYPQKEAYFRFGIAWIFLDGQLGDKNPKAKGRK